MTEPELAFSQSLLLRVQPLSDVLYEVFVSYLEKRYCVLLSIRLSSTPAGLVSDQSDQPTLAVSV